MSLRDELEKRAQQRADAQQADQDAQKERKRQAKEFETTLRKYLTDELKPSEAGVITADLGGGHFEFTGSFPGKLNIDATSIGYKAYVTGVGRDVGGGLVIRGDASIRTKEQYLTQLGEVGKWFADRIDELRQR